MNFQNKKCDGCGLTFEENDDIVVCPECGTPQHRSCFENAGGCVNASKHEEGFEWKAESLNVSEPVQPLKPEESAAAQNEFEPDKKNGIFGNMDPGVGEGFELGPELPELNDLIESRVKALAPGITAEQRREQLCGKEIGTTISFIGSNAASYVKKFRKREQQNKHTFNWAAFFFAPYWFFYRKLYKAGAIFISIFISISLIMAEPAQNFLSLYQGLIDKGAEAVTEADIAAVSKAVVPILIFEAITLVIQLIAGFTADKMYWKHCKKTLEAVDEYKRVSDHASALSCYLRGCSTSFFAALASIIAYSFLPQLLVSLFK